MITFTIAMIINIIIITIIIVSTADIFASARRCPMRRRFQSRYIYIYIYILLLLIIFIIIIISYFAADFKAGTYIYIYIYILIYNTLSTSLQTCSYCGIVVMIYI